MEENQVSVEKTIDLQDYNQAIEDCYKQFLSLGKKMDETCIQDLKEILTYHNQDLNTETYMHVMLMAGVMYEQQENKNAARYCALRMLQIKEAYVLHKKSPRYLDTIPYAFTQEEDAFITRYTSFLEETYRYINRRLLLLTLLVVALVFVLFVFLFKIQVLFSLFNAAVLGFLNYYLQKKRLPDMFKTNQLQAIEDYVDEDVLEFDRPIRYS